MQPPLDPLTAEEASVGGKGGVAVVPVPGSSTPSPRANVPTAGRGAGGPLTLHS